MGRSSPCIGRGVEGEVGAERHEHVVDQPAPPVEVARLVDDHPRHAFAPGERDQLVGERPLPGPHLVPLDLDREPVAERLAPLGEEPGGLGVGARCGAAWRAGPTAGR